MPLSICLYLRAYLNLATLARMALLLSITGVGSNHLCSPYLEVCVEWESEQVHLFTRWCLSSLLSAFGPRLSLPGFVDLVLLYAEIIGTNTSAALILSKLLYQFRHCRGISFCERSWSQDRQMVLTIHAVLCDCLVDPSCVACRLRFVADTGSHWEAGQRLIQEVWHLSDGRYLEPKSYQRNICPYGEVNMEASHLVIRSKIGYDMFHWPIRS